LLTCLEVGTYKILLLTCLEVGTYVMYFSHV
jgi:hypothetical protein